jgi:hypothetical protein
MAERREGLKPEASGRLLDGGPNFKRRGQGFFQRIIP